MSASTGLLTFASLQNDPSATSDLNQNFAAINTALGTCLSLNGQTPNQMLSNLDMNGNRILNLPPPVSILEPMRLMDATTLNGGGTVTVSPLPTGGTAGQLLGKNSSTNFDVSWQTPPVSAVSGKTAVFNNSLTMQGTDGTTITFQGTDTYISRGSTDTLTNKTINFGASGNSMSISGVPVTGVTGTGQNVLATSPSLVSPNLSGTVTGTPTFSGANFIAMSNITQAPGNAVVVNQNTTTGNLTEVAMSSLPQKVVPTGADLVMISDQAASGQLKFSQLSAVSTSTGVASIAGNTGAFTLGTGLGNTVNQINVTQTAPTVQTFTSGTSLTYTPTSGTVRIKVRMCGGGGGGGANNTNAGQAGVATTFGTWTAGAGSGGAIAATGTGGTGGINTTGTGTLVVNLAGQAGGKGGQSSNMPGGMGGNTPFFSGGGFGVAAANGVNASTNTGGGGGGGGGGGASNAAGGGGSGGYLEFWITSPSSLSYTVGGGGSGGAAGTFSGGNGGAGIIIVEEFYI